MASDSVELPYRLSERELQVLRDGAADDGVKLSRSFCRAILDALHAAEQPFDAASAKEIIASWVLIYAQRYFDDRKHMSTSEYEIAERAVSEIIKKALRKPEQSQGALTEDDLTKIIYDRFPDTHRDSAVNFLRSQSVARQILLRISQANGAVDFERGFAAFEEAMAYHTTREDREEAFRKGLEAALNG